jgi:hypothetical protein
MVNTIFGEENVDRKWLTGLINPMTIFIDRFSVQPNLNDSYLRAPYTGGDKPHRYFLG